MSETKVIEKLKSDIEIIDANVDTIEGYTKKIDNEATNGLLGVNNSSAYRIHEIERHLHSNERWFGVAVTPSGETHVADRIGVGVDSFEIDAGNNTWGSWVQILGSSDTPAEGTNANMDLHRILVSSTERNATYFLQLGVGATGQASLDAETYTEVVFQPASNQIDSAPVTVQSRRSDTGVKVWARCLCPGQDTAKINFYFGIHEYEG